MKNPRAFYFFILLVLSGCLSNKSESVIGHDESGIIGGEAVLSSDPIAKHIVLIHTYEMSSGSDPKPREYYQCTGVIVGKRSILTAAHCFEKKDKNKKNYIEVFFTQSAEGTNRAPKLMASRLDRHPFYENKEELARHFDLMVITLAESIPEGFESASILPAEVELKINDIVVPAGFGIVTESDSIKNDKLNKSRGLKVTEDLGTHFLVDQKLGSGICSGDSGGPTFYNHKGKFYLVGINQAAAYDSPKPTNFCHQEGAIVKVQTYKGWILSKVSN